MADPPQTSVQVLKHKHSMLGESLLPVIAKLKAWDPDANSGELCRLKKGHPLEEYSLVQLRTEFERLTGESVKDIFAIVRIDENLKSVRQLVHLTILQANLVGMPKGQALQNEVGADNQLAPRTTVTQSSGASGMSGANVDISSRSKDTQNLQVTLSSLKQEVDALKTKRLDMQVDEALANIRTLASRPKLTAPHVLLAAIETLVDIALTTNHKEAAMFSKAFSTCKKYEDNEEFCSLVLKLFGSQEDKRIASLVADWAKSRKYESSDKVKENTRGKVQNDNPVNPYPMPSYPGFGIMHPYGMQMPCPPAFPMPPIAASQDFSPRQQFFRGNRGRRQKSVGACFYCKEPGHFVSNCPKIKKE